MSGKSTADGQHDSEAMATAACAGAHAHAAVQPRHVSLRTSLFVLVLICVLPGVALCAYLVLANYQLEKRHMASETERLAGQILVELDRELAAMESGLRVLATAEQLKSGELHRFHEIARAALKSQTAYAYVLIDPQGRQILNTLRPYGTPLPASGNPTQLAEIFESGKTVLTDLFVTPLAGKQVIALGVPVYGRDGTIIYTLVIGLLPEQLIQLLNRQPIPSGWLAAIIDGSGTVVALSRDGEQFVGRKALPDLRKRLQDDMHGSVSTTTEDGTAVTTAYARSARWNWSVATGAPKTLIEAGMFRLFTGIGLAALFFIVAGSWLAIVITRRVLSSVEYLNDAALALREGKPLAPPRIQLYEAEAVGEAIVKASHLMAEVHHRAYHDPLTELANRALFYELLQHQLAVAERENGRLAVLAIDLDNFKVVNDEEGHPAGDHLLEAVARRIESTIRASDAAARMGGDEFSILLVDADRESAVETAQRLVTRLAEPYDGIRSPVSASIGIAIYPTHGKDICQLLENADRALYVAKHGGRNAFRLAVDRPTAPGG
ncbi:sensor domain-containing diguanylate cyclase [uncultured Dechloromonas sp.]|uniref:bifunctional diguanylate cyclase/phosphodiesterase n=1 Tax=uncultured Dechloromonas sp. TaxID=171719 RepID=UPI0025D01199|nr:sensor domain-containing diguanylate cyclase [uncultured Dechloromonas sp.]